MKGAIVGSTHYFGSANGHTLQRTDGMAIHVIVDWDDPLGTPYFVAGPVGGTALEAYGNLPQFAPDGAARLLAASVVAAKEEVDKRWPHAGVGGDRD